MKYDKWNEYFKDDIDLLSNDDVDKWDISDLVTKFEDKILKVSLELFKGID